MDRAVRVNRPYLIAAFTDCLLQLKGSAAYNLAVDIDVERTIFIGSPMLPSLSSCLYTNNVGIGARATAVVGA